ncbi:MAG TPA: hypothetical protein ENG24_01800 [Thermoplasmatales archaeon]|nr:MAG: hypothetical protein DRN05_04360 [Thermoplasmata archaeon]HDM25312.1 hypothetical protein [Thermoplasmatales archaeon]
MYFKICFATIIVGIMIAGVGGLIPYQYQYQIPDMFRPFMIIVGISISLTGYALLYRRAKTTGTIHLIKPALPNTCNWFYVHKDDEIVITPAIRMGEGILYSEKLDSKVPDVKTYTLADHKIRIVPEVVGHAVDLDYVLYTNLLKTKYGFENLREARESIFKKTREVISREHVTTGAEAEKLLRQNENR